MVRGEDRVPVRHLGELRNASAYFGGPEHYHRARQPQLLKALTNLDSKQWVVRAGDEQAELEPLEAYRSLQERAVLKLESPQGKEFRADDWIEVGSIDYIFASQDPATLKDEQLGQTGGGTVGRWVRVSYQRERPELAGA